MRKLTLAIFFLSLSFYLKAQLPACTPGTIGPVYTQIGNTIYEYDQSTNTTTPLTVTVPGIGLGIVLINNTYTWITTVSNIYRYYDQTTGTWINTGQATGTTAAVNIGGGCAGGLYNLNGTSGQIWEWSGAGTGALFTTISDFAGGGPYDIVSDEIGNIYMLRTRANGSGQWFRQYSSAGVLLNTWTLVGMPDIQAGGGFAMVGDSIFVSNSGGFHIGTRTGSTINFTTIASPPTGMTSAANDYASCPNIPTFGQGSSQLTGICISLPLELIEFEVETTEQNIARIYWETFQEDNLSHFELEKSSDGVHFQYLESIPSRNYGGNSLSTTSYETNDYSERYKSTYYRLKMIDLDGQFQYSWVINLNSNRNRIESIVLSPQPTTDQLHIEFNAEEEEYIKLTLYNLNGKSVLSKDKAVQKGINKMDLNLGHLANGIYLLQGQKDGEPFIQEKVLITR